MCKPSSDPVPPSTSRYRFLLTQYHHISTSTTPYWPKTNQVSTNTNLYCCCLGITDFCTVYPGSCFIFVSVSRVWSRAEKDNFWTSQWNDWDWRSYCEVIIIRIITITTTINNNNNVIKYLNKIIPPCILWWLGGSLWKMISIKSSISNTGPFQFGQVFVFRMWRDVCLQSNYVQHQERTVFVFSFVFLLWRRDVPPI